MALPQRYMRSDLQIRLMEAEMKEEYSSQSRRWYDKDPVISRTVEILRIVPPEAQRICAQNFIRTLKEMGINYESKNVKI